MPYDLEWRAERDAHAAQSRCYDLRLLFLPVAAASAAGTRNAALMIHDKVSADKKQATWNLSPASGRQMFRPLPCRQRCAGEAANV